MIRMIQSKSAGHAKAYFSDALITSDYYLNDQEINGAFQGKLSERLRIEGLATKKSFFALCENVHPESGKPLTPRTKEERTIGYDINFHCPKSVSIVHALYKDANILEAFQESVSETMKDIEADSKTRVRKKGVYADRNCGEMIWVDFTHQTARPVEDHTPDPHLHAHCFTFNMTWDEQEQKLKACQFRDIKRDMPFYQSLFHKRLSDKLIHLGYQIERTNSSFEIEGVPKPIIELFSKRSDEIGRVAKEQGITDAKSLDGLGAKTRSAKQKGMSMEELRSEWRKQIQELNLPEDDYPPLRYANKKTAPSHTAEQCIDYTLQHCFERASVAPERRILANAYRHSLGDASLPVGSINRQIEADKRLIRIEEKGQTYCTTKEVLREEQRMVRLANAGRGQLSPLYQEAPELNLKGQQAEAVRDVLTSGNRVSIIRGAAGAGKTTLMQEAVEKIEQAGKTVTVVAPTAQASRGVLREEGFEQAETVAALLANKEAQDKLEGQVLWVDEAGLLGTKDMCDLLDLATEKNARIILGGDTRQHTSVVRGDALRILNTVGGIQTSEVNKIYRQKSEQYKRAVEDLSKGDIKGGFEKLDEMGFIKTVDPLKKNEALVDDFVEATKKGITILVISPTHKQGEEVTEAIRTKMRQAGLIGKKERKVEQLSNMNFTKAEKSDWRNFKPKQRVQFNQNLPNIKRGSLWEINETSKEEVTIKNKRGDILPLPKESPDCYEVYQLKEIGLSKGDKIRITKNGFDKDKRRLNNGQILEVETVRAKGEITFRNAQSKAVYKLPEDYGHISHAHCVTSHNAQGRTTDFCFVSQPASTFSATDAKQFYVSVSRAREQTIVYTDDKEALLDAASQAGDRRSAMELLNGKTPHMDYVQQRERNAQTEKPNEHTKAEKEKYEQHLDLEDYEPRF